MKYPYNDNPYSRRAKERLKLAVIVVPLLWLLMKALEYFGFEVYQGAF